ARKTITVTSEINNSTVYTLESVEMGDRGVILGGEVYAVDRVRAGGIGRKAGKSSKLHLGIDFTAEQEKEKNNNHLKILDAKIRKIREILETEEAESGRKPKLEAMLNQLLEEQQKTADRITELLGRVIANEDASLEVFGVIIPGTLIEICQVALFVAEPLHHARLRLDRELGKIVIESL
ncbi:MAG: FapA family protein, partial [Treponema sp.]|nr:FapA family protein [Treponema sp.]